MSTSAHAGGGPDQRGQQADHHANSTNSGSYDERDNRTGLDSAQRDGGGGAMAAENVSRRDVLNAEKEQFGGVKGP